MHKANQLDDTICKMLVFETIERNSQRKFNPIRTPGFQFGLNTVVIDWDWQEQHRKLNPPEICILICAEKESVCSFCARERFFTSFDCMWNGG